MVLDTQSLHAAAGVPAVTTGRDAAKKAPGRKRGLAVDVLGLVIALLELPDPPPAAPPAAKLPGHPVYRQIMAVFATADTPLRARAVRKAMDVEIVPNNINNVRLKLKRLVERGILVETEQGLFTQPRP